MEYKLKQYRIIYQNCSNYPVLNFHQNYYLSFLIFVLLIIKMNTVSLLSKYRLILELN